ncbi:tRNA (N6-isopentenyl adenosine(37)-C2)-methylthiotransferase MiaB [Planctomycetota bacterium]
MSKRTVHIKSFGCQMNKLDTALVSSALQQADYVLTDNVKEADVVLINTCSVRDHAEQRVFSHLGQLKHLKKNRPEVIVGIMGCMAQRLGETLLEHEAVDLVCGPAQIPHIVDLCETLHAERSKQLDVTEHIRAQQVDNPDLEAFETIHDSDDKTIPGQAFVRIMRGCNNFCTYCIVPYVRGPEVSRSPEVILEQVRKLSDQGVKQITLLGQTVNAYRYDTGSKTLCLADLLAAVSEISGIEWIRFVTSYPTPEFFTPIMQAMAHLPKVCSYLHLPAQSGSDRILKAMNRHYTAQEYLDLLAQARDIVPDLAVAGDFIVGFPGETDDDFEQTAALVRQALYKNCFVFKYSPRPGTTSDRRLEDNIPTEIKQQRNVALLAVQETISQKLSQDFVGRTVTVLVEGPSKKPHLNAAENKNFPQLVGRTATDWIVVFNGPQSLAGQLADVTIEKANPLTLFGQPLAQPSR